MTDINAAQPTSLSDKVLNDPHSKEGQRRNSDISDSKPHANEISDMER
jgi:hypothetical protein